MKKFSITLKVIDNDDSIVSLTLSNHSESDLKGWELTLDFPRFIIPETFLLGQVVQIGTFTKIRPNAGLVLAAHSEYTAQFKINSAPLLNHEAGIKEAFITLSDHSVETISINKIQLKPTAQAKVDTINVPPAQVAIIPQPLQLHPNQQQLVILRQMNMYIETTVASKAAAWLAEELSYVTELQLSKDTSAVIQFIFEASLKNSEYVLSVCCDKVLLKAASPAGFAHAVASLIQCVKKTPHAVYFEGVDIFDKPEYDYRGLMLDCARHFHSIKTVKRLINQMAQYKLNYFHWHLTDDEGWRIEIKAFPELTKIGAWRGPGTKLVAQFSHLTEKYGGFYTQAEIQEVIQFAAARGVTIVPEIDIPGHCRAAIYALPELLIDSDDHSEYRSIQAYTDNVLSPALAGTYTFIDKVMEEVSELFPGPYIHIGADEVPAGVWSKSPKCDALMAEYGYQTPKQLQGHLLRHVEKKLTALGKRMLGWEEVKFGDKVSKDTVIYSWISEEAGLECVQSGFDVVMQPCQFTYFDLMQSGEATEYGVDWAGVLSLQTAYEYQPLSKLTKNDPLRSHILGVQCALWSEVVLNQDRIDYMLFPRMLANAEVSWSTPTRRDWQDFSARLMAQIPTFERQGISYRVFSEPQDD